MSKTSCKKNPDFYTETCIILPYLQKEYEIKLSISGIFIKQDDKLIPKYTKYSIINARCQNKNVSLSKGTIKYIDEWIKNNPNKFNSFIMSELGVMVSAIVPKNSKTLDKIKVI